MKRHALRYADWSWREYAAAARCVLAGAVRDGDAPARLGARLAGLYAPARVYPVNFGRTALTIALQAMRVQRPGRSRVILPAYICPSVVDTVRAAGLEPVAAPVGPDLNLLPAALAPLLGKDTLAVLVAHMFGCPARVDLVEAQCAEAGVFLIDDAAQVVGERLGARLLGTFGDVGILSFAQSKGVVTGIGGSGGVLLVNQAALDDTARTHWNQLDAPAGRLAAFIDFAWSYQGARYTGNSAWYLRRALAACGRRPPGPARPARISNLEAAIALVQLDRLGQLRAGRLAALEAYRHAIASIPGVGMPQYAPGRCLSRVMLSLPAGTDLAALRRTLTRFGVDSRLGYQTPVHPACPDDAALRAARSLLGLPFGAGVTPDHVAHICRVLQAALAATPSIPLEITKNEPYQTAL